MTRLQLLKNCSSVALSLASCTAAAAQTAPAEVTGPANPPAAKGDVTSADIIVTGLRRETTVQNTAATIDVLSAESLEKSGVQGSMALQFQTPGVLMAQDVGLQTQVYIRGIGSNLQGIAVSNSVSSYLDGVYLPNATQSMQSFNDVDRIEVLKGPQATLYGRNATGGAINIVTQRPSFKFRAKGDLSYGNYNAVQVHGSVSGPVTDTLALSLAAQYTHHDGYAKNLFLNKDVLQETVYGIRGGLLFKPSSDFSILLRADYTKNKTSDFLKLYPITSVYYIGTEQYFDPRPRVANLDIQPSNPIRDAGVSATIEWNTGLGKVTSVSSFRDFKAGPVFSDSDQIPVPGKYFPLGLGFIGTIFGSKSYYHETYLSTDVRKPFSVILGGTYFNEDAKELKRQKGTSAVVSVLATDRFGKNEAYALYADGTYKFSDVFSVVGGIRYTHETRDYNFYRVSPVAAPTFSDASFSNWSPRFGIEVRPRDGLLLYATATSGFKSGGFNTDAPTNNFGPEKIWSYEAGIKTTLFDIVRFNASAFYYDYKDIQILQFLTINNLITPIVTNAGSAKLWGSDISADVRASSHFSFGGGVSLLHSEFGSAIFCDPLFGSCTATDPANRPMFNIEGNQLPRAPKVSGNLYADYRTELGDGEINFHVDASYRARTYFTVFENKYYSAPSFGLLGANVRYTMNSGVFVEAFGQNLANKLAITNLVNSSPLRNPATGVIIAGSPARFERYSNPRIYGVRVGFKF